MLIIIGLLAGICTSVSFIPQSIKTIQTRNTESISLLTYCLFISGVILWIIYGFLTNDVAVYATNLVTFIPCLIILILKLKESKK